MRTRIPIILFCLPVQSMESMLCLRVGGWVDGGFPSSDALVLGGEMAEGRRRPDCRSLDDPAGAFAIRWVLALLGWAETRMCFVFWQFGGMSRAPWPRCFRGSGLGGEELGG